MSAFPYSRILLTGVFLLTAALYATVLNGSFVYDDVWYIVRNPAMHRTVPALSFLSDPSIAAAPASGLSSDVYRPLTTLWFWIDAHLWGPWTMPYHLQNLLLHLLNGYGLLLLLRRYGFSEGSACVGVAVFLLHPVQVESVAWISQRSTLAATSCVLISLLAWVSQRMVAGLIFAGLAILFKEIAIVIPILWFLFRWVEREKSFASLLRAQSTWVVGGLLVGVGFLYVGVRFMVLGQLSQFASGGGNYLSNGILGLLAFSVYLGKIILPMHLRVSYTYPVLQPGVLIGAICVAILFVGGVWILVRRDRWATAGLIWIVAALLPVLQILPIRAFVAERFLYLPMVGVAILLARLFSVRPLRAVCVGWLVFLSVMTARTVPVWRNEGTLWHHAVRQDPGNGYAHLMWGATLTDPHKAVQAFRQALSTCPNPGICRAAADSLALAQNAASERPSP